VTEALTEGQIQKRCVGWAKRNGWKARKYVSPGNSGVPDYLFRRRWGICVWVEFKAPGGKLSAIQEIEIADMREDGFIVYVCDNFDDFCSCMLKHM
jgi:hypothetical protein